jgi:PAS domain S-box-containing protein
MHIPVVMLSARSGDEAAVVGLEAGADDYLVKPFSARELKARVRANLELDRARRIADELARNRTLLDQAEELAHVGSWELDLDDGRASASPEYLRITGCEPADLENSGLVRALAASADDRQRLTAALEHTAATGEPLDVELVLAPRASGERTVRVHGVRWENADGRRVLRGSLQDITEQRAAEIALAASAAAREAALREHAIAEELQRSLLPAGTAAGEHLRVAAYYASGTADTQAGGDWYDVIKLSDTRTALVVGDVMGRGVRAAAVMGQLRATVAAYARLDLSPARVLHLLDAAVREMTEATIVTCVYAVHDAAEGTLTYGNAGHLPPLLTGPKGGTVRLLGGDPPLGTNRYGGRVETVDWPVGARLTLYTDGLVEHRGSDIDLGIDSLIRALDAAAGPPEALPGRLIETVLAGEPDDDVAILVAVAGRHRGITVPLALTPRSVAEARGRTRELLESEGVDPGVATDAVVVVSELVTNAVRYGRAPASLSVRLDEGQIVVEVSDGEYRRPDVPEFSPSAPNGRGIHMVAALGSDWGVRPIGMGKSVWCTLSRV